MILKHAVEKRMCVKSTLERLESNKRVGDFSTNNLVGISFNLADVLKVNRYVLIEFWASWCSPCRAEIPFLKEAYAKYSLKGFEIVSFSLDHEKEKWAKASEDDGITWIDVGDLRAHNSPVVALYGVTGIPDNYLVNSEGEIVATKLRREKLNEKLKELLDE